MIDHTDKLKKEEYIEPDQKAVNNKQDSGENISASDVVSNDERETIGFRVGVDAGEPNEWQSVEQSKPEKNTQDSNEFNINIPGNNVGEMISPALTDDSGAHRSSSTDHTEPSGTIEAKSKDAIKKRSQSSIHKADAEHAAKEENTTKERTPTEITNETVTESPKGIIDNKSLESSLGKLVREASESTGQKSKTKSSSLTARLFGEQIRTGKLNQLTSVVQDEDGTKRIVHPGSVPHWNTIDISLAGKRPMPSEKCRKGEHNCFESAAARRERALSANLAQGLYPDFMRLNPKLNEFVAASILEKLRLKGLAAPLHLYRGRSLPSDVIAELVLKPKRKKVTDRYYFGYVPPPNRPRCSSEFRRYLRQFAERHRAAESDLCYSHALKKVRQLAEQSVDSLSLPQTLAEVIRAQEEPGFGVSRLRRPRSAVI